MTRIDVNKLRDLAATGRPLIHIAAEMGVPYNSAWQAAKRNGIPRNPDPDARAVQSAAMKARHADPVFSARWKASLLAGMRASRAKQMVAK